MTSGSIPSTRYAHVDRIATGGMGEVWRAHDAVLGRDVAVKVLKHEYADDPDFRARFQAEARNAASLHHPGIAAVFDFGELEDGVPFLVMELVEGKPLSELMRDGRLDTDRIRDLMLQTAEALGAVHSQGLVHRDVKPANLLVTPDGVVKITDFGIARAADGVALTRTGQLIGTPQYLSPEQAEGRPATAASDVYALGVVLFECLAGRRPFVADTPVATALKHLREPVPPLPAAVPADLATVVNRAMAKDPAERYADGTAFAAALQRADAAPDTGELAAAPVPVDSPEATQVLTGVAPALAAGPESGPASDPASDRVDGRIDRQLINRRGVAGVPWPLAAIIGLAVVLVIALLLTRGSSPHTPTAGPTGTPSATTTPSTAPVKASLPRIVAASYVGRQATQVEDALQRLGYTDVSTTPRSNPGGHTAGTVAVIAPTGQVATTTPVRLTVWSAPAPAPKPPPKPAPKPGPRHHKHAKGKGHK